jgi:subtilisin family serine protease
VARIAADPRVAYVEADGVMKADTTQSGATWGIDRIDQRSLPLSGTYTYFATGSGVKAYIIVGYAIAAGNGDIFGNPQNACNFSPARVAAAMTISATDRTDTKASWANYGSCVDWFAPGMSITSAWYSSDTATNTISGTSMATPHTTGVAALYLQGQPGSSPSTVRTALFNLTTKSIVKSSNTTNNHLLFTNF